MNSNDVAYWRRIEEQLAPRWRSDRLLKLPRKR
jgi:hypothetical protein